MDNHTLLSPAWEKPHQGRSADPAAIMALFEKVITYITSEFGNEACARLVTQEVGTDGADPDIALDMLLELIEENNIQKGVKPFFHHLPTEEPTLYNSRYSRTCSHTRLPAELTENLSLRHACKIGTWGRYRVLEKKHRTIPPASGANKDVLLFILHCNIHNFPARIHTIERVKKRYAKWLAEAGVKDIVAISTNEYSTEHDDYTKDLHFHHEYWSPHYVVSLMKRMYEKFPDSIVLTHRYIGSLLLDNELYFNMHFLIDVDNMNTMTRCFSDILHYMRSRKA